MTSDAASGHAGLWTEPRYPGDSVRVLLLKRDGEIGSINIQFISDDLVKVCSFLPGESECSPGDTPKIWPEKAQFTHWRARADVLFDNYVQAAYADGWQNYNPEIDGNG